MWVLVVLVAVFLVGVLLKMLKDTTRSGKAEQAPGEVDLQLLQPLGRGSGSVGAFMVHLNLLVSSRMGSSSPAQEG